MFFQFTILTPFLSCLLINLWVFLTGKKVITNFLNPLNIYIYIYIYIYYEQREEFKKKKKKKQSRVQKKRKEKKSKKQAIDTPHMT